ncbi:T-cell activation inhibitor, mitochondrial [Amia ocellicauda]|uniref:T-cell activation inhibitor, mitochondrial n=1 Tax=Amia ocellicauda TaxID=2972642 RepID=UPI0034646712
MSVTCFLRHVARVTSNSHIAVQVFQNRLLSGADAVNALRPFYFAVHPDFFGQHPREREVNENSLKRLNGYIENLQKPNLRHLKPTQLTFYVRETVNEKHGVKPEVLPSGFRAVSFTLQSRDIRSTVLDVLTSCSLPTEHMQALSASVDSPKQTHVAGEPFYRPIRWDKTYYSFTGFRDPEEDLEKAKRVENTLSSWLSSNEASATKKQKDSLPHRAELKRLKKMLCHKLRLADIRWQRSWGIAHRCSQLHSLSRLHQQNPESLLNVEGHTIIFTDQSGMNAAGHVMLGTTDVHHQWAKLFERLPSYSSLLAQSELLKDRISQLLGGIQVIHIERLQPLLTIEEYFNTLSAFQKRLSSCWVPFHPRSLQGLQMTLENDRSSPRLHELGHFIIPSACEPTTLQWFIQTKAPEARRRMKRRDELEAEENDLVLYCLESLSLKRLYKEPSVSSKQMIPCCRRLMEERCPYVQGMRLCVSHFYSVLQDGDLCIPWDWKS